MPAAQLDGWSVTREGSARAGGTAARACSGEPEHRIGRCRVVHELGGIIELLDASLVQRIGGPVSVPLLIRAEPSKSPSQAGIVGGDATSLERQHGETRRVSVATDDERGSVLSLPCTDELHERPASIPALPAPELLSEGLFPVGPEPVRQP